MERKAKRKPSPKLEKIHKAKRKPPPKMERIHKAKPKDPSKPPHETPVGYRWGKNKSGKYAWIKNK